MKLNGTNQHLVCNDDNMLGKSINTINKNTKALLQANKEVDLDVNTEKTKYMLMSHHQNVGQNPNLLTANKFLKNVTHFKYWEQMRMFAKIQFKIFCLPTSPLKYLKIKIHKTIC
jgi:hypothetical protein